MKQTDARILTWDWFMLVSSIIFINKEKRRNFNYSGKGIVHVMLCSYCSIIFYICLLCIPTDMEAFQSNFRWDLWDGESWRHYVHSRTSNISFFFLLLNFEVSVCLNSHLCYYYFPASFVSWVFFSLSFLFNINLFLNVKLFMISRWATIHQWVLHMQKVIISHMISRQSWRPNFWGTQLMYTLLEGNLPVIA